MTEPLVLAIDQGTTNTKAVVVAADGEVRASASVRVGIEFPQPGWAQSDGDEIWRSVQHVMADCLREVAAGSPVAIGISNQRESVVGWERATGALLGPVVSWQCGRSAPRCAELRAAGYDGVVRSLTGLAIDPMFAATKMAWLLDAVDDGRARAADGEICLGTVDSWLIWKLTHGDVFATDFTNASRTLLLDLDRGEWSAELLDIFGVPRSALPALQGSISSFGMARLDLAGTDTLDVPIWGVAGDSHAALVGHHALSPGAVKASFGTGTSVMAPHDASVRSPALSTTVAWSQATPDGPQLEYALEGNIYATGSALEWTATMVGLDGDVGRLDALARTTETTSDVCFVPALSGLGAPHWDATARGLVTGLTRAAGPAQLARAAFEAVAHQVADVLDTMERLGLPAAELRADGGAIRSDLLASLVADLTGTRVVRSEEPDVAAVGAALLAGVGAGVWPDLGATATRRRNTTTFDPRLTTTERGVHRRRWADAVRRTMSRASS